MLETEGPGIQRVELYPTVIRDCHAGLATGVEAEAIGARMARLCAALGASPRWRGDRQYLEVRVPTSRVLSTDHPG